MKKLLFFLTVFAYTMPTFSMRADKPRRHKVRNELQQGDANDYELFKKREQMLDLFEAHKYAPYVTFAEPSLHKGLAIWRRQSAGGFDLGDDITYLHSPWRSMNLQGASLYFCNAIGIAMSGQEKSGAGVTGTYPIISFEGKQMPPCVEPVADKIDTNASLLEKTAAEVKVGAERLNRSIAIEKEMGERFKQDVCTQVAKFVPISALVSVIFGYYYRRPSTDWPKP